MMWGKMTHKVWNKDTKYKKHGNPVKNSQHLYTGAKIQS